MTICDRIRALRKHLGLKQKVMAEKLKFSHFTQNAIEKGRQSPTNEYLQALTSTYNVNMNWLMTGEGGMFLGSGSHPDISVENSGVIGFVGNNARNVDIKNEVGVVGDVAAESDITKALQQENDRLKYEVAALTEQIRLLNEIIALLKK